MGEAIIFKSEVNQNETITLGDGMTRVKISDMAKSPEKYMRTHSHLFDKGYLESIKREPASAEWGNRLSVDANGKIKVKKNASPKVGVSAAATVLSDADLFEAGLKAKTINKMGRGYVDADGEKIKGGKKGAINYLKRK